MKINKLIQLAAFTTIIIGFSACGGGGGGSTFKNSETLIPITVTCKTPATIDDYLSLESGDVIAEDENATIKTYHDTNGTKKVCLVSGTAHIIKGL